MKYLKKYLEIFANNGYNGFNKKQGGMFMKTEYEKPQIEIVEFELSEGIMMSGDNGDVLPCHNT